MFTLLHPGSTIIATESHQATRVIKSGIRLGFICNIHGRGQIVGECLLFKTGPLIKRTMKKCETLVDDMHAEGCMHDMCQRQRFTS